MPSFQNFPMSTYSAPNGISDSNQNYTRNAQPNTAIWCTNNQGTRMFGFINTAQNYNLILTPQNTTRNRPLKVLPQTVTFIQPTPILVQPQTIQTGNRLPLVQSLPGTHAQILSQQNPIPLTMQLNISTPNNFIHPNSELCQAAYMAFKEFNLGNYANCEICCNQWLQNQGETHQCYILLSFVCLRLRLYKKLEEFANKILSLNPSIVEPYVFLGICCKETGRISEALGYYRLALQHHPDNIDSIIGLSNCYLSLNDFTSAGNYIIHGFTRYPDSIVLRNEFGNIYRVMGKLDDARRCAESILESNPNFAPSWFLCAQINHSNGNTWLTLHNLERVLACDPYQLDAHIMYANILRECKLTDRSLRAYSRALSIFTEIPQLYGGLGCTCLESGLHDAAIENFRRALAIQPLYPDVLCNLANALKEKGQFDEAEQNYLLALKIAPNHADSYNNLANILRERGKVHESIIFYRKALEISPNFAAAHSNLATVYQQCGKLVESITHFQHAVNANPNNPDVLCYLGNVYREVGNFKSAIDCYLRAINLNTFSSDAHAFLANTYKEMGHTVEAIAEFVRALMYRPNFVEVFCNLVHSYLIIADWNQYESNVNKVIKIVEEQIETKRPPSVHPHHTMLFPMKPETRVAIANRHALATIERVIWLGYKQKDWNNCELPNDTFIKIGYVSSDFCNHPTSHLIQSIPGLHDRKRFKVYCYSLTPSDQSSFRIKIESEVDYFIDISTISDPNEIAMMIQMHGIHILLNLNGYTKGARNEIFALKPAPIQIMYLGYPGTSGAVYMDYIITDKIVSPLELENNYSEKFAYMPNSFFIGDHAQLFPHVLEDLTVGSFITAKISRFRYYSEWEKRSCKEEKTNIKILDSIDSHSKIKSYVKYHCKKRADDFQNVKNSGEKIPEPIIPNLTRAQLGIPDDGFVYCNFNQIYKFDPKTFDVWCKILERVPNSYLWLLRFPKKGEDNLREYVKKFDIEQDRLVFTEVSVKEEHVRRGQLADVCLDTVLCNGHTTGMDVLWAGCPIVTLSLETFASRVGASIITAIGLGDELIANSYEEYIDIAVKLGTDKNYYSEIKAMVWYGRITSSLFNVHQYTRDFDSLLIKIWENYKTNRLIDHVSIDIDGK